MMNEELSKPFIKNLLVVSIITVVAMVSGHYMVNYYYSLHKNTTVFTSASPENTPE